MPLSSILKGVGRTIKQATKPLVRAVKPKLNGLTKLERDRFESLLDRVPEELPKHQQVERYNYLDSLQDTDLRGYQDYRQRQYKKFLKEAGVKKRSLRAELLEDLQEFDHIRGNYAHYNLQEQRWSSIPVERQTQVIASSPALAYEAKAFRTVKRILVREPKTISPSQPAIPQGTLARKTSATPPRPSFNKLSNHSEPPTQQASLRRVHSDPNFSFTPLNLEHVFGPDLKAVTFKQKSNNTCYVLATLDNILHHPQGAEMLKSIEVTKTPRGYQVKFPAQQHPVEVLDSELKAPSAAHSNQVGIPVLEQAYLKLPNVDRQDIGESLTALGNMFHGSHLPDVKPFNWTVGSLTHAEYKDQLRQLMHNVQVNPQQLPIMTAVRNQHISSVRLLKSTPDSIKLLDPIHGPKELPIDDFIEHYQLIGFGKAETTAAEGLRAALEANLNEQLNILKRLGKADPENLRTFKNLILNDMSLLSRCYQVAPDVVNSALNLP